MSKIREQAKNTLYACPCCGYATIGEPAEYEICEICFWEDDGQDDPDSENFLGGPNGVSLNEARFNFLVFGAAEQKDLRHCREPSESDTNLRNYYLEYRVVSRNKI
ncbi:CPCC family cysteine-rich protein [Vibrio sinaloensis]|uniref:CPCC family cysteine-rich protein n=1 Tax=Photobacterium sp. (strain ATCC 43367) TaxID=379097 RepID=UPI0035ED895F